MKEGIDEIINKVVDQVINEELHFTDSHLITEMATFGVKKMGERYL